METYKGFVKLVRRDSQQVTLAYQDATPSVETTVYLLSPEDFGVIMPLKQILLNIEVGRVDVDLTSEVLQMHTWHQVSPQVLAAVAPAFRETLPPTPEEWRGLRRDTPSNSVLHLLANLVVRYAMLLRSPIKN